jgi:hypothetical protein
MHVLVSSQLVDEHPPSAPANTTLAAAAERTVQVIRNERIACSIVY